MFASPAELQTDPVHQSILQEPKCQLCFRSTSFRFMMNGKPFCWIYFLLLSSSLCLMSTWLHIFIGLYLVSLRIIAQPALGVNSLRHREEHSVWYNHEAAARDRAPSGRAQGNNTLQLLYPPPPPCSSFHWLLLPVLEWWLTDSLVLWILVCLMTPDKKFRSDERHINDYSFFGCLLGSHPLSPGSVIILVCCWCRAFTVKLRGG